MNKIFHLGNIFGLKIMMKGHAAIAFFSFWVLSSIIIKIFLTLSLSQLILGGLVAACLYWVGAFGHHLGHQAAAKSTGYPMSGVVFVWILATSLYPRDEPQLPGATHIRRAAGGPLASFCLTLIGVLAAYLLRDIGGLSWYLALFFAINNFFVFTIGALLPLGFTDGSTILKHL